MKVKGIKLSEAIKSLQLLQKLCNTHETCSTCWLYDQEENETACLLAKTGPGSLNVIIWEAMEHIAREHSCMMPECPYCPTCGYGYIRYPEYAIQGEEGLLPQWHCTYDPEVGKGENTAVPDGLAGTPGGQQRILHWNHEVRVKDEKIYSGCEGCVELIQPLPPKAFFPKKIRNT